MSRIGGKIQIKVDGTIYNAKGAFTYNLGRGLKTMVVGSDRVHGHKELPQVPFIEGIITDTGDLDLALLQDTTEATVTIDLANGKVISLRDAVYANEGTVNTEEGEIPVRWEGISAEEIR